MRKRVVVPLILVAAVGALALPVAPRAWSYLAVKRVWVRPSDRTMGYCTVHRITGRLSGPVEVWSSSKGELFACGTFRDGRGALCAVDGPLSTIELSEWTPGSLPAAIQSLEELARRWRRTEHAENPLPSPRSLAPWVAAGIPREEWWASVPKE